MIDINASNILVLLDFASGHTNGTSGYQKGSDFVVATTTTTNPITNDYQADDEINY